MKEKRFLISLALVIFILSVAIPSSAFNWRQFEGEKIRVLALKFYYTNFIKEKLPEFEKLTGIKVVYEQYPEDQYREKIVVEHAAGSTAIDAFWTGPTYEGMKFYKSGWYQPLNDYLKDPNLTNPDFEPEDFVESVWAINSIGKDQVSVPVNAITWLLMYRKDLYKKYGIPVPKTLAELEEAAKKLTLDTNGDGKIDIFGFAGRGKKTQAPASWGPLLYAFGGSWLTPDRKPAINSPQAIEALKYYKRMMRNYANPGAADNHWHDVVTLMQQGRVANMIDTMAFFGYMEDPKKSKVVGKIGCALVPAGPGAHVSDLWCWAIAISKFSKKKKPAWLFIQWATSKDIQKWIQRKKFPTSRKSSWNDPEFKKMANPEWIRAIQENFKIATKVCHPQVVAIAEVEDVVGLAITNSILGADPKAELDKAQKLIEEIMAKTE
ncbi:MAG: sugar ABC transporter substrate-binding protein [Deltaproteobacteria bacterium]|nr:sugar ABC transporter substrate-binding protein [Deltaproteobacteria bacterium]MBW1995885.1 sugar ABC transporter substrate-binding protein [Deltaproteobacteria bacterium]MBW2153739.1 sugar ABC transporter substrate-binding protein [Deltaproteobacteria bacterium]